MPHKIDKKALWRTVVESVELMVGTPLFHMLLDCYYLDSIEDGAAIVATDSEYSRLFVQKKAKNALELGFSQVMKRTITVKFTIGNTRIFEKRQPSLQAGQPVSKESSDDAELAMLHERYGDIMGIVDNHPVFKKACIPSDKGGWGVFPQLLTNACKEYGVIAILNGLRLANRPSVKNPRGFFFAKLKKGDFGYRLAVSAPTLGRVAR